MSASRTLRPRKRNVCMFNFGHGYCALEECVCASLRFMFPQPAVTQAEIDREVGHDEWLADISAAELFDEEGD